MKRVTCLLGLLAALLLTSAFAQPSALPDDARFDTPVEFKTEPDGESLRTMLAALARSIGLTAIVEDVPDVPIVYDIGDPKPFRQVWSLVLTLNDLDYALLDNDVIVVGPPSSVARVRGEDPAGADGMQERFQRFYKVQNDPSDVATILRRAVAGVDVEVLASVSSLSVLGTQAQHDRVQATLDQFDRAAEVVPLELRTYALSNADAETLAPILQNSGVITAGENGKVSFTVVAEPRTNSLLVSAPASIQARIAELLPDLDVPQRQVNVQVRIQEISTRSARDLGINLNASVGKFAASVLETGLSFVFDPQSAITSLNIGAVLDTLETQGLARRVDDTTLTVLNNDTGSLQSGGTIIISIPGATQNIERTIPYGVQVEVTPRISSDGRVTLEVVAKVEDVLSNTNDPSFLHLSTREVVSTVTLEPGQTVLLGGLLQNVFTQSSSRVPVLGALPLIGPLFGSTSVEEDNVELLLIVDATVVD